MPRCVSCKLAFQNISVIGPNFSHQASASQSSCDAFEHTGRQWDIRDCSKGKMDLFTLVTPISGVSKASQVLGVTRKVGQDCLGCCTNQSNSSNLVLEQDGEVSKFRFWESVGLERLISISAVCTACWNAQSRGTLTSNASEKPQQPLDVTRILFPWYSVPSQDHKKRRGK